MNKIYIDGVKTRQNIADETHRAFGVKQLCEELGVPTGLVTKYIRQGYGDGQTIIDLIRKGIPFELSKEPVPCRVKKAHSRGGKKKTIEEDIETYIPKDKRDLIVAQQIAEETKDKEMAKAEWHLLNALKASCESIIQQIEAIQQNAVYESIFGGEEK